MVKPDNVADLVAAYDLVADCTDNFTARYLISDACFHAERPLVSGAVGQFDGTLTVLKPYLKDADGTPNPTYRCLFPEPPPDGLLPSCAEAGILGALTGVVGTLMAMEAIKEIVGFGDGLVGRLLMYDALAVRFETIDYRWDETNPLSGTAAVAAATGG
jgi:adenylyltransferase/sulfurtransferase